MIPSGLLRPGITLGAAVLVLGTLILLVPPYFGQEIALIDLAVYRWGGIHAFSPDLYISKIPASSIPGYFEGDLPFTYTPFAAILFVPFGWISLSLAQWLVLMINLTGLATIAFVMFRAEGFKSDRGLMGLSLLVGCSVVVLEPGFQNLLFGQVNILLVLAILWDTLRPSGNTRGQGIAIGLAAALKLTPAIFILYFLATGRWKAAARSTIAFAAATGLAAVLAPQSSYAYWLGGLFSDSTRVGGVDYVGNQSLAGLFTRTTGSSLMSSRPGMVAVISLLVCGLVGVSLIERRNPGSPVAILVIAFVGLLISPISWTHHWIWVVPLLVHLIAARFRGERGSSTCIVGLLSVLLMPGVLWLMPHGDGRERNWNAMQFVVGNAYVFGALFGLCGLVVAWLLSTKDRTGAPAIPGSYDSTTGLEMKN